MNILVATTNPHKLEEIEAVFRPLGLIVQALSPMQAQIPEPDENQPTFLGNAELKALYYAKETMHICLADDSGLSVDALGGSPGVFSARYAKDDVPADAPRDVRDAANNAKLLKALEGIPEHKRAARFVCAMCVATPAGEIIATSEGFFEGRIAFEERGEHGFGYDPLLVLDDGRHAAELSAEEKNALSHRGEACRAVAPKLKDAMKGKAG